MRSLSFTRSSARRGISVTPSANAAATASTGSSSTIDLVACDRRARRAAPIDEEVADRLAEPLRSG